MIENLPFRTIKHRDFTIEGYSRAAVQTYWRIPEMKLGFDLGGQPWDFMGTPTWFVSHGHLDHVAALPTELLIVREGNDTVVLHYGQMWRMQLYFWDSGYRAFTANVGVPGDIVNSIEEAVLE